MESFYLNKNNGLVLIARHEKLHGAKIWSSKYCLRGKNNAPRNADIYIMDNGLVVAMRVNMRWVCPETDARRRAKCELVGLDSRAGIGV